MTLPYRGIWIDDPVRDVLKAEFWDKMVEHKLTVGAIMLEGLGDGFNPSYNVETLGKIKALALPRNIEIILTTWPEPDPKYMREFEDKIEALLAAAGASGLEFDLEGNWLPAKLRGYHSLDHAGDAFVETFQRVSARLHVRTECTTYPFHTENSNKADVAPHCDRLLPQAYSVRHRTSGEIGYDSPYGPGGMQRLTLDKAKMVKGVGTTSGPLISCGLAAYDQVWPTHTGEQAMKAAYDAALKYEPIECRWWSSKWVFGIMAKRPEANRYASRFLKSL